MEYTEGDCSCTTEKWEWVTAEKHHKKTIIKYCPKHKAADALYEACKEVVKTYKCSPTSMQPLFWLRCVQALAQADGK